MFKNFRQQIQQTQQARLIYNFKWLWGIFYYHKNLKWPIMYYVQHNESEMAGSWQFGWTMQHHMKSTYAKLGELYKCSTMHNNRIKMYRSVPWFLYTMLTHINMQQYNEQVHEYIKKSMKVVLPPTFYFMKILFSDISRSTSLPNMINNIW